MDNKARLALADDSTIARSGLRAIVETSEDIEVVAEASTAQGTVSAVMETQPDLLLLDMVWFGDNVQGVRVIEEIRRVAPKTKILVVTAFEELQAPALRAGADAYLFKDFTILTRVLFLCGKCIMAGVVKGFTQAINRGDLLFIKKDIEVLNYSLYSLMGIGVLAGFLE